MVKFIFIIILAIIIGSCRYVTLPQSYFNNYTKITQNNQPITNLNMNKVYVLEDTFVTRTYHKYFGFNGKSYRYCFIYKNNLMAQILTPIIINSKVYPMSIDDLSGYIKNGFFAKSEFSNRINWTYYEVINDRLITYGYSFSSSIGNNTLNKTYIVKRNFILTSKGLIYESDFNSKTDTSNIEYILFKPIPIAIKPDSSESDFIKSYNKYISTGGRRYYSDYKKQNKYLNKK